MAGGANNQLATPEDGEELHRRGIIYAPDFLINAGGIINAAAEIGQPYNPERSRQQTERIYEQMSAVLTTSRKQENLHGPGGGHPGRIPAGLGAPYAPDLAGLIRSNCSELRGSHGGADILVCGNLTGRNACATRMPFNREQLRFEG